MPVDDVRTARRRLADPQRPVPLGDRLEIGRHEAVHVIADAGGQLVLVRDHEPGPAGERAPDPERDGEAVAALDGSTARAQQPEGRARAGREHEMT